MAKEHLDASQVGTAVEHVRRARMPQGVRGDMPTNASNACSMSDDFGEPLTV
jgi:hypothetical protein